MIKIAIIGAGKGGSALLDIFHANEEVKVVGITDEDRGAPGLVLAEKWGIVVAGDINEICRHKPDIVILDIRLPDIDGYEVCTRLRRTLRTSHVPIIFLTQKDERSDKLQGLELGADDYITKPFDVDVLLAHIKAVLRRSERQTPLAEEPHPLQVGDRRQVLQDQGDVPRQPAQFTQVTR